MIEATTDYCNHARRFVGGGRFNFWICRHCIFLDFGKFISEDIPVKLDLGTKGAINSAPLVLKPTEASHASASHMRKITRNSTLRLPPAPKKTPSKCALIASKTHITVALAILLDKGGSFQYQSTKRISKVTDN